MLPLQKLFVCTRLFRMFEQGNSYNQGTNISLQKTLKVRPCFIRLMRDREVDQRLSKKSRRNETEVNNDFILSRILPTSCFLVYTFCYLANIEQQINRVGEF